MKESNLDERNLNENNINTNIDDDDDFNKSYLEDPKIMAFLNEEGQAKDNKDDINTNTNINTNTDKNININNISEDTTKSKKTGVYKPVFDDVDPNIIDSGTPNPEYFKKLINDYCANTSLDSKVQQKVNNAKNKDEKRNIKNAADEKFNGASSIDTKFKQYFKIQLYYYQAVKAGQKFTNEQLEQYDNVNEHFAKIIRKVSTKACTKVLTQVQTMKIDHCAKFENEKKWAEAIVPKDDPNHKTKADIIATLTSDTTLYVNTLAIVQKDLMDNIASDAIVGNRLYLELGVNLDMTMGQLANKLGLKGAKKQEFFQSKKTSENETVKSCYTKFVKAEIVRTRINSSIIKVAPEDMEDALLNPEKYGKEEYDNYNPSDNEIFTYICDTLSNVYPEVIHDKAKSDYIKNHKLNEKQANALEAAEKQIYKGANNKGVKDWRPDTGKGKGDKIITVMLTANSRGMIQDHHLKAGSKANYQNYLIRHSGYKNAHEDIKKAPDNLAKSMAAMYLYKAKKPFSVDDIHKTAARIKLTNSFKEYEKDPVKTICALSDVAEVQRMSNKFLERTYGAAPDKIANYTRKMADLYNLMEPNGSASSDYTNLREIVGDIATLAADNNLNFNTKKDRETGANKVAELNIKLIEAAEKYMKGKKSIRTFTEGKLRFEYTLSALGELCKFSPEAKAHIEPTIQRINKVRDVKPGDKDYVDIGKYSTTNASDAKQIVKNEKISKKAMKENKKYLQ